MQAAAKSAVIRTVAGRLVKVRSRKSNAAFRTRLERDAASVGCTADELLAEVKRITTERAEQHKREAAGWEKRQAAELALVQEWAEARAKLLAAGWHLTYESESGSEYYERDGQTLRLADHLVPNTGERDAAAESRGWEPRWDHEIIVGSRAWRKHVEQLNRS